MSPSMGVETFGFSFGFSFGGVSDGLGSFSDPMGTPAPQLSLQRGEVGAVETAPLLERLEVEATRDLEHCVIRHGNAGQPKAIGEPLN